MYLILFKLAILSELQQEKRFCLVIPKWKGICSSVNLLAHTVLLVNNLDFFGRCVYFLSCWSKLLFH